MRKYCATPARKKRGANDEINTKEHLIINVPNNAQL